MYADGKGAVSIALGNYVVNVAAARAVLAPPSPVGKGMGN